MPDKKDNNYNKSLISLALAIKNIGVDKDINDLKEEIEYILKF
tara:strand:- start:793 stop:921 length:129 start_codon:yes stop_codon:yes gene_type:complete